MRGRLRARRSVPALDDRCPPRTKAMSSKHTEGHVEAAHATREGPECPLHAVSLDEKVESERARLPATHKRAT